MTTATTPETSSIEDATTQELEGYTPGHAQALSTLMLDADTVELLCQLDAGHQALNEITNGGSARIKTPDAHSADEDEADVHHAPTLVVQADEPTLVLLREEREERAHEESAGGAFEGAEPEDVCPRPRAHVPARPPSRSLPITAPGLLIAAGIGVLGALGLLSWASVV